MTAGFSVYTGTGTIRTYADEKTVFGQSGGDVQREPAQYYRPRPQGLCGQKTSAIFHQPSAIFLIDICNELSNNPPFPGWRSASRKGDACSVGLKKDGLDELWN